MRGSAASKEKSIMAIKLVRSDFVIAAPEFERSLLAALHSGGERRQAAP
jgi:hypothetical protein